MRKQRGRYPNKYQPSSKRAKFFQKRQFKPRSQYALTNSLQPWARNYAPKRSPGELGSFTSAITNGKILITAGNLEAGLLLQFSGSAIPSTLRQRYQRMRIKKITVLGNIDSTTAGTFQVAYSKDTDAEVHETGDIRRQNGTHSKCITTGSSSPSADNSIRFAIMWPINIIDGGHSAENNIFSSESIANGSFKVMHMLIAAPASLSANATFVFSHYFQVDYIGYNRE